MIPIASETGMKKIRLIFERVRVFVLSNRHDEQ